MNAGVPDRVQWQGEKKVDMIRQCELILKCFEFYTMMKSWRLWVITKASARAQCLSYIYKNHPSPYRIKHHTVSRRAPHQFNLVNPSFGCL